jgi:hypothetical protein
MLLKNPCYRRVIENINLPAPFLSVQYIYNLIIVKIRFKKYNFKPPPAEMFMLSVLCISSKVVERRKFHLVSIGCRIY